MPQDFSKKITIVLREGLASWHLTNTIGHIAAYLGNKMSDPFDTGEYFVSRDNVNFPRNSQFPVIALRASEKEIKDIAHALRDSDMLWIVYVQEMIDYGDDEELAQALRQVPSEEMDILGIGIFGPNEKLKVLTGGLKLWK